MPTPKPESDPGHDGAQMSRRKAQHLEICTSPERYRVEGGDSRLGRVRLVHHALPEIHADEVDTGVDFLGRRLGLPFFISSMTGGSEAGYHVNKDLARLAARFKVPVGMGSIRILFRKPEVLPHFMLKELAPDVPVFANLGAVQVRDMVHRQILDMVKRLGVDGLTIHLNPAQELFQAEGDRDFRGILDAIKRFCDLCPVPVVVKETGCGIHPAEVTRLLKAGAAFANVAGSGGTNWAMVESARDGVGGQALAADEEFRDWGNPTGLVLAVLRQLEDGGKFGRAAVLGLPDAKAGPPQPKPGESFSQARVAAMGKKPAKTVRRHESEGLLDGRVLASGGIRSGMDMVNCLALGARLVGAALPVVRALQEGGIEAAAAYIERLRTVLVRAMVLSDCQNVAQLRAAPYLLEPGFRQEVAEFCRLAGGPA